MHEWLVTRIVAGLPVLFIAGMFHGVAASQTNSELATVKNRAVATHSSAVVEYNQASDQLTVDITDIQLRQVMAIIARKSGIRVMMDAAVKQSVTAKFKNQALMEGLKQLLRHTNSAYFFYSKKNTKPQLLLAIKILPKGKQSSSNLQPLVSLPSEAILQARNQASNEQYKYSNSAKRWQARQNRMPKKFRERLDKITKDRLAAEKERKKSIARYKEKLKAKREKKKGDRQARQAAIDNELKTKHPDLYEERQRIRAEGRARAQREQDERGILTFGR